MLFHDILLVTAVSQSSFGKLAVLGPCRLVSQQLYPKEICWETMHRLLAADLRADRFQFSNNAGLWIPRQPLRTTPEPIWAESARAEGFQGLRLVPTQGRIEVNLPQFVFFEEGPLRKCEVSFWFEGGALVSFSCQNSLPGRIPLCVESSCQAVQKSHLGSDLLTPLRTHPSVH